MLQIFAGEKTIPLSTGQVINNRYRIVKLLGQGGFGAVYRAWDIVLERPCALKENLDPSAAAERQFLREAKILAHLRHPNLPDVKDHLIIPGQGQYLMMDYVDGKDLGEILEGEGGSLPEDQALNIILQVCRALEYLHSQNPPVIHRDIKPSNIKINSQGQVKLVDFGIAKVYDAKTATTLGAKAITPGYSPQEQYLSTGRTDERSDLYALGATLYSLLTGEIPAEAPGRSLGEDLVRPTQYNNNISIQVEEAVIRALQLLPKDRFQSISEFKAALIRPVFVQPTQPLPNSASSVIALPQAGRKTPIIRYLSLGLGITLSLITISTILWVNLPILIQNDGTGGSTVLAAASVTSTYQDSSTSVSTATVDDFLAPTSPEEFLETKEIPVTSVATSTWLPTSVPSTMNSYTSTPDLRGTQIADAKGFVMALVPAGEFLMGSEEGDEDEKPVHKVYLDAYYIDVYKVTNAQFVEFLKIKGMQYHGGQGYLSNTCDTCTGKIKKINGIWQVLDKYTNHPVETTWFGARDFCEWRGVRHPTEAEWEKAARGGLEGKRYPWGDDDPVCQAGAYNGAQFSGCGSAIVPVGTFAPNGYGLFDMAGNVWEIVQDYYLETYYRISPFKNPTGLAVGNFRVMRGGDRILPSKFLRVAERRKVWIYSLNGVNEQVAAFRCVRSP